jgi:hypothetical protein
MLGDKDSGVRVSAALALGQYGSQAKLAVPALQQATQSADADLASFVRGALLRIEHRELITNVTRGGPFAFSGSMSNETRGFSSKLSGASQMSYDVHP